MTAPTGARLRQPPPACRVGQQRVAAHEGVMTIHLQRDAHGDRDVYSCPAPASCPQDGPHPGSALLGQIVQGRTMTGIRYGAAFTFTEWQWIPDDLDAEPGPVRHAYSPAFDDARRYAKSHATGSVAGREQDSEALTS